METLRPLKPPLEIPLLTRGEMVTLVVLGLLILIALWWFFLRKKPSSKKPFTSIPVDLTARQWIEALLARGEFLEAMGELDTWLLKILSNRFEVDLRFLTSLERKEILMQKKAWTQEFESFFNHTDRLKFSEDRSVQKEDIRSFLSQLEPWLNPTDS